jgi:hypothetical protein
MEDRLPPQLMAVVDWPFYRLFGRCWAQSCGRRIVLHSPWALYICERTPIGVVITDKAEH